MDRLLGRDRPHRLRLPLGGAADAARPSFVLEGMRQLGYPDYFALILGVWKVLGGIAVLLPRSPLLKEWAYAGMFFDLIGASASHAAVGDPAAKVVTPLIILGIVAASWALRPESRKLPGVYGSPIEPTLPKARLDARP